MPPLSLLRYASMPASDVIYAFRAAEVAAVDAFD